MITTDAGPDGLPVFNATISGLAIYLDNFSLISLAKGDPSRRQRFLSAVHTGGVDLLFSLANAAELTGPQGQSLEAVRAFLGQVGAHWFPVELDPFVVTNREVHGGTPSENCASRDFMKQYFAARTDGCSPGSGRVIDLSENFFRLAAVLDWVVPQRDSIRQGIAALDDALIGKIGGYRAEFERDPQSLDRSFPALSFNSSKPATFTYVNLVRTLILDAKAYQLKKGDGIDFCHAVLACAFASVATLDKHWKRRVEGLPEPNKIARIYYEQELDKMVADIESWAKT